MIAFLTKSDASEGFEQIINFLNAHVIQYALMVNPTIYVSCINQFWTSVSIKKINDVVRLQVLIDRNKVIITKDSIRQALRLDDADSVDCLSNEENFAELARMGYEKPSTKLTFYKAFSWLNGSSSFIQFFNYTSPALTQQVFANMRRIGKGLSKVDTPLFNGMLVPQQAQDVEDAIEDEEDANNEVSSEPTSGSESRPPMLNKENYVPWSSCLLRYAKSRPNGKLIHNSILNGPYVRRMIHEPGDANREVTVTETFHVQTDDELSDKELKQIETDDQAIQTILLGLPEDIYATVDREEEKIASNLKFLNNLQPEWSRHVTIVHQTKDLHTADYTQLYDFLKYNQKEVDELKAERLAKTQDPLALMANSNNLYAFPASHQDQ
nr:hypothetical protein [Tanacetum cinerariifolium]